MMMKLQSLLFVALTFLVACNSGKKSPETKDGSIKDAYEGKFLIGVALNTSQVDGSDTLALPLIEKHFNSVVAENCMKSEKIQPKQGEFTFDDADKFIAFAEARNMFVIGHCLVWHSQAPGWFFVDSQGKDVSRDTLVARMKTHIQTVVSRYKGRVHGWDVVNEAFEDDGQYRQSKFYQIIGPEYIDLAFKFANEADPDAELYYNDYSMAKPGRRDAVVKLVTDLKQKGIRIDAVGMQGHITLDYPLFTDYEKSIVAFAKTGVQIMVSELDITVLPNPFENTSADIALNAQYTKEMNPYPNGMPDSISQALTDRYINLFSLLLKYKENVSRVTLWGLTDNQSWRNDWPIAGRVDYPLLFNRDYRPKPLVDKLIEIGLSSK